MAPLTGFLEKSTKYTKSWAKRFISFDPETCKLDYGESQAKVKASLVLTKITRRSENDAKIVAGSPDLFSFTIEGTLPDGKEETFNIRCPDRECFNEWFFAVRNALGSKGSMDPFNYGLPPRDPRTNLELVSVPVEHLYRFHLLDRAIMYFFAEVEVHSSVGGEESTKELLIIGDRCVYLFRHTADVHRCIPITSITKVYAGTGVVGVVFAPPQHDLLLINCLQVSQITNVLQQVLRAIPNTAEVEVDTSLATLPAIADCLHLTQREGFKHAVIAPTPKPKLKAAMDVYEKTTGQPFVYGSAAKPAAAMPKQAVHQAPADVDINDPLAVALMKCGLNQYIVMLQRQHVDLDLLAVMEPEDLANFGIENAQHRRMISAASRGEPIPGAASPPPQSAASPTAVSASPKPQARVVSLDDDDDDLPPPVRVAASKVMAIVLTSDDDDDGLTLPPPKPAVVLSDDEDLPPPKPAAQGGKPVVNLDDDDDI